MSCHSHPIFAQAVARDRVVALRHGARSRRPLAHSARRRTGWLLVDVGLRLALGR